MVVRVVDSYTKYLILNSVDALLPAIRRRKLSWFGHVCQHDTLPSENLLQGTVEGGHRRGNPCTVSIGGTI